jgi:anti-sigma factor RsiW
MTPTDCQSWFPSLSAFIDGELPPARRVQIERHLATCPDCAARVGDLRATSGLVRVGMEMRADEADFSDFFEKVLAKIEPDRVPLWERWKLTLSELFTYHRGAMISSLATAAVAVMIAVPIALRSRPPPGYASAQFTVQRVSTEPESHVAPVVMKGDKGNTIIWTVNHRHTLDAAAGQPSLPAENRNENLDSQPEPIQKQPLKQERPRGGEL